MDGDTYSGDVPHPGFFLREELEARDWSQRDLAWLLNVPEQAVNMILSGKRGISPDMARALGDAFSVNPEFFINLQRAYDMSKAREPDPGVARKAKLQGAYPVREMIKRGWLQDTDAAMLEIQMARFFKVANASDIPHMAHAAKKTSYDEVPPVQLAWLFRVRQIAESMSAPKYSEKALRDALKRFRQMSIEPEEIRHVPRVMMECGVRYVIVESLPGAKIDGVCFWLDRSSPVIGMSLRHDRIDNYWFVLRHEIEHILRKHGVTKEIIDDLDGERSGVSDQVSEEERVANEAAMEFAVASQEIELFIARKAPFFSERDVIGFARRVQAHPGIIVGQIQKRTDRWELLRKYLVKIRQHALPGSIYDGWGQVAPTM